MMLARSAVAAASRRAAFAPVARRAFVTSLPRRADSSDIKPQVSGGSGGRIIDKKLEDIQTEADLRPEGAQPGTVPTDLEQATGLERLEILGKMQGIDIFDMRPLPSDRLGTLEDPILIKSQGEEQYLGCTGSPADSHHVIWLTVSRDRPLGRCPECGSCYLMEYVGPQEDAHGHHDSHDHHHHYEERKTFADFIKPEYYYR